VIQLEAVALAAVLCAAAVGAQRLWAARARTAALAESAGEATGRPYVLYFWGPHCTICRTHQEPALGKLEGVDVRKVDALAEAELAERYHVYTLPTTIVVGADGATRHVNYGYAPAKKLEEQLAGA
jgi:thiol-disulfide isomerase/thioredoxin